MSDELKNLREENDNMINETVMLKAKVNRLEREKNETDQKLMAQLEVNTALRLQADTYFEQWQQVSQKARAFDNYTVDLVKSMETYPHEYLTEDNFVQKTYEFYMQDKEDFIKFYKDDRRSGHEVIADVEEYDEIIKHLEGE